MDDIACCENLRDLVVSNNVSTRERTIDKVVQVETIDDYLERQDHGVVPSLLITRSMPIVQEVVSTDSKMSRNYHDYAISNEVCSRISATALREYDLVTNEIVVFTPCFRNHAHDNLS